MLTELGRHRRIGRIRLFPERHWGEALTNRLRIPSNTKEYAVRLRNVLLQRYLFQVLFENACHFLAEAIFGMGCDAVFRKKSALILEAMA